MADPMLDQVVHNLTHRRFKGTSKLSPAELGTTVANSFFDPRNVGNFEAGEIAPSGKYLTHYPVNVGSNTAGFSIMDDEGDDRRGYYPSQVYSGKNALVKQTGGSSGSSSGSASDYVYFNPYYEALLNPKSKTKMEEIAQPHYLPRNTLTDTGIAGRGTNAPSSASAIDYAMNNPYAFKSNFNGGSLGASSSGSSSDYYDSNPNRVPAMQSETRHFTDFMTEGGAIDFAKYLGYIKKGAEKIAPHIPTIVEHAPRVIEAVRDIKGQKGALNKLGAVARYAPEIYKGSKATLDTVRELRGMLKERKAPAYRERQAPAYRERQAPAYRERQAPAYRERQAEPNINLEIRERRDAEAENNTMPKKKAGRPKKEKVVKPKGKVGRPKKALRTMNVDL